MARYFYRCVDSLVPFAIEEYITGASCSVCGSHVEYMGTVAHGRLHQNVQLTPCDDRCIYATGPKCECACGAKNHGNGRLITVTRDNGAAPTLIMTDNAAHRASADTYRAALADAHDVYNAQYAGIMAAKHAGQWIDNWQQFMNGRAMLKDLHYVKTMRTQAGRLRALTTLVRRQTA